MNHEGGFLPLLFAGIGAANAAIGIV